MSQKEKFYLPNKGSVEINVYKSLSDDKIIEASGVLQTQVNEFANKGISQHFDGSDLYEENYRKCIEYNRRVNGFNEKEYAQTVGKICTNLIGTVSGDVKFDINKTYENDALYSGLLQKGYVVPSFSQPNYGINQKVNQQIYGIPFPNLSLESNASKSDADIKKMISTYFESVKLWIKTYKINHFVFTSPSAYMPHDVAKKTEANVYITQCLASFRKDFPSLTLYLIPTTKDFASTLYLGGSKEMRSELTFSDEQKKQIASARSILFDRQSPLAYVYGRLKDGKMIVPDVDSFSECLPVGSGANGARSLTFLGGGAFRANDKVTARHGLEERRFRDNALSNGKKGPSIYDAACGINFVHNLATGKNIELVEQKLQIQKPSRWYSKPVDYLKTFVKKPHKDLREESSVRVKFLPSQKNRVPDSIGGIIGGILNSAEAGSKSKLIAKSDEPKFRRAQVKSNRSAGVRSRNS